MNDVAVTSSHFKLCISVESFFTTHAISFYLAHKFCSLFRIVEISSRISEKIATLKVGLVAKNPNIKKR